jgi:predicted metal-dependent hydrolase
MKHREVCDISGGISRFTPAERAELRKFDKSVDQEGRGRKPETHKLGTRKCVTIRLPWDLYELLKSEACEKGIAAARHLAAIVRQALEKEGEKINTTDSDMVKVKRYHALSVSYDRACELLDAYSEDYLMTRPLKLYETEWAAVKEEIETLREMISEYYEED